MASDDNRLFLAFPARELASPLARLQDRLSLPGRRIPAAQLHLTLLFIGRLGHDDRAALLRRLARMPMPGFELVLDRLGCFPRAGVVWAGPSAPPAVLMTLAGAVELACRTLGQPRPHRAYRPHITLFRHCTTDTLPPMSPLVYRPRELCLYHSELTAEGPLYHCLQRWPLTD
ncbi:RNA 2',3'-cyclic phosphodiesterase [Zobellella taiwanensis]|uniref:RNA 2',3'-cyclic phosphodiesterase n=1 Tax=Zobellella taiwanensis TaxID=347535 RepID=A0A2P7QU38_9GAMM|nr:RNA 2',3'-cyclic phosphodiesterase [Zobellella taiwanensis]PSJ41468.1 RNA 2',3'-cyclic phosphodiesterase [Zobellella taiwanensis]